jgi:hypothetical protein
MVRGERDASPRGHAAVGAVASRVCGAGAEASARGGAGRHGCGLRGRSAGFNFQRRGGLEQSTATDARAAGKSPAVSVRASRLCLR